MRQAASDPRCRDIFVLQLVVACAFHVYNGTSDLYVRSLGYSSSELGYILSYAGTTFALCNLLLVPRLAAAGTRRLLPAAFVCVAVGRAGLGAASWLPPTPTILAAYVVCNFGQGLLATLLKARLSAGVAPDRLALLLSLLDATRATAGTVVPLVSGVIYDTAGPSAPAAAAAAIALSARGGGVAPRRRAPREDELASLFFTCTRSQYLHDTPAPEGISKSRTRAAVDAAASVRTRQQRRVERCVHRVSRAPSTRALWRRRST